MLSRIQDLPRYKADCERFDTGVRCTEGDIREEGKRLFEELVLSVLTFDDTVAQGMRTRDRHLVKFDHVQAQERLAKAKEAMEQWMLRHAPNVHVDETKYQ